MKIENLCCRTLCDSDAIYATGSMLAFTHIVLEVKQDPELMQNLLDSSDLPRFFRRLWAGSSDSILFEAVEAKTSPVATSVLRIRFSQIWDPPLLNNLWQVGRIP